MIKETIYVQLLEEGTVCYRPVSAIKVNDALYQIEGHDIYDPSDEIWEFEPGSLVYVEEKKLSEGVLLVAVSNRSINH